MIRTVVDLPRRHGLKHGSPKRTPRTQADVADPECARHTRRKRLDFYGLHSPWHKSSQSRIKPLLMKGLIDTDDNRRPSDRGKVLR